MESWAKLEAGDSLRKAKLQIFTPALVVHLECRVRRSFFGVAAQQGKLKVFNDSLQNPLAAGLISAIQYMNEINLIVHPCCDRPASEFLQYLHWHGA